MNACLSERVSELENEWRFYVNQTAHAIRRHSFRQSLDSFCFLLFVFRFSLFVFRISLFAFVCIWHELFDWRKTLTHFLTHSLAHSDTHVFMYADNSYNMTQTYDRKAKSEKRKTKSKTQNESRLWRNECLHMAWAVWLT